MIKILLLLFLISCNQQTPAPTPTPLPLPVPVETEKEIVLGNKTALWATVYFVKQIQSSPNGVKVLDVNGNHLGPIISNSDFCRAAIEGTFYLDGVTYNYHSSKAPNSASCNNNARSRARWFKSPHRYGVGNKSNALIPYVSIACDQKIYAFGQKFFIPAAKGAELPDGTKHDGVFVCHDIGSMIKGNHIDVFLGMALNDADALARNPFNFVKSNASGTFEAFLIK